MPEAPRRAQNAAPDPLDRGLLAAFGQGAAAPQSSVLRLLQAKTGSKLGMHLADPHDESENILKVSEEAKSLRDPSGRYQVLGEIGRGGMGAVFKGHDTDLGRDVALKVLHEKYAGQPEVLARFVEEAQIGGQLQHPGIVPVYELGLQDGERPFFAMKLVKGTTLQEQLGRRKDPSEDRRRYLGIFEQVCQTLAYAHARHVVHRDLKPQNVMIGAFGEVQVVDWGFAKVLPKDGARDNQHTAQASVIATARSQSGSGTHSVMGSMLGTPAYMPPEQANGQVEQMDARSDVFGLGGILCEILTAAPPYLAADGDLVQQAARGDLSRAHERIERSGADEPLIELCKLCLSPNRLARPLSAREVAEPIGAYLSSVEDRARAAQIHAAEARVRARSTMMLSAAALLILLLGGGGYLWVEQQATARRDQATQRIAEAMRETSGLLGQAKAAGTTDLALWDRTVAAAAQAERLARDEDVGDELRKRTTQQSVEALGERDSALREARLRERDAAMLQRLVEVRIPADDDVRKTGWQAKEARRLDAAYAEAFRAYLGGTDLRTLSVEVTVLALQDGHIEIELAAALDHWAFACASLDTGKVSPSPAVSEKLHLAASRLDHADAWRNQVRVLLAAPKTDRKALEKLAKDADIESLPATSVRLLRNALWNTGAEEAAIDICRRGAMVHPSDFDLCFRMGLSLEGLEEPQWQDAAAWFRVALALRPDMKEVMHRLGRALEHQGNLGEALEVFRRLVAVDPRGAHWHFHIGGLLDRQGHVDEAIGSYRRSIELDPDCAKSHLNLGVVLSTQGHKDEAIASYRRAIERDPTFALAHNNLGSALRDRGQLEEAIGILRHAIELDPKLAVAHYALGLAVQKQDRFDESIACYERAIELDPKDAMAHVALGYALMNQGHPEEAIASYRRSLELDPKSALAHYDLGCALNKQGQPEEAIVSFRRSLELDPNYALAHYDLGYVLSNLGRLEDANTSLRRSIELDPKYPKAHMCLGSVLNAQGHPQEAIASYGRAIDLDPKSAWAHFNLGTVLNTQGRHEEAMASYGRAIELDPGYAPAQVNLGLVLESRGNLDEALTRYRSAREICAQGHDKFAVENLPPLEHKIQQLERLARKQDALIAIAAGKQDAASAEEWTQAADLANRRGEHVAAAHTYERAFAAHPELATDAAKWHRYNAACAAALAASGAGEGADRLATVDRCALRNQALNWLEADVAYWRRELADNRTDRTEAMRHLRHSQTDRDLEGVRGKESLEKLSREEAESWRGLWSEVMGLIKQVEDKR